IDASMFSKLVLTIDAERKKITVTAPFRPPYMKLTNRTESKFSTGSTVSFEVLFDNVACEVVVDTWNRGMVSLTSDDYVKLSVGKKPSHNALLSVGFGKNSKAEKQFLVSSLSVVKSEFKDVEVAENSSLKKSLIGYELFKKGIVTLDFSKNKIYFQQHGLVAIDDNVIIPKDVVIEDGKMNPITAKYFKEAIYDYSKGGEFKSKADKIYVVDFWATWCGPCMKLLPMMEQLAEKYKGQIVFCKVNADKEKELCNAFNIKALPTLFFIAQGKAPIIDIGAKIETYIQIIEKIAKNKP
ncbi:MAG: thioredoxin domain-containing protein, partial [Rikenellaceae bacterium]